MAVSDYPKLLQSREALQQAAKLAEVTTQKPLKVPALTPRGSSAISSTRPNEHGPTNTKALWLTFFFDGTGNNLDADLENHEHSNVARLFLGSV